MSVFKQLWQRVAGSDPMPQLPDGDFEAFLSLVDALQKTDPESLQRGTVADVAELLPLVALSEAADMAILDALLGITELVPMTSSRLQEMTIYVDPHPDKDGRHRMYIRDEAYLPGSLWAAFPTIEDGAEWLAKLLGGQTMEQPEELEDEWELSPWSGAYVLETLLIEGLPEQWQRARAGESLGPAATSTFELEIDPSEPHWRRAAALWLVLKTIEGQELGEVAGSLEKTGGAFEAFVAHLRDLQTTLKGQVPAFVSEIAASEGPLSLEAEEWIEESEERAEAEEPPSEFALALRARLEPALREMIASELIEVEEPNLDAALTRLVAAAEDVANNKQLIAAVVRGLLNAPEIEEVYGSDTELRSVVIKHFRG